MHPLILVFIGGGLGSMARFAIGDWLGKYSEGFPWGTFIANVLACLALGGLLALDAKADLRLHHKLILATGFCGGFSTFSTFSGEVLASIQSGNIGIALIYVGCSLVAGLAAIYVGYQVVH